jgi:prolyl-tRNA editing enzyme YbaK/EbsC (Cys-tRNA(Pro) deacylase)
VLGVSLGQIAKSVGSGATDTGLVVTSGERRVDEKKVAALTNCCGDLALIKVR